MNAEVALNAVQVATYQLRRLYLGDRAGDQLAVANTPVPEDLVEITLALHVAQENLLDDVPLWEDQAVELTADGPVRLLQLETCRPA
jgi:hypothetical protein